MPPDIRRRFVWPTWPNKMTCLISIRKQMNINDITYAINGAAFEVNRILGSGFLEKVYENALLLELRERGFNAERQMPVKIFYKKKVVGEYIVDILVEKKVIVELKTVEKFDNVHEAQLLVSRWTERKVE